MTISRSGDEAESRFMAYTGARPARERARGDCQLDHHYVEVKKAGADGTLNQVRPVKYIPLVVWQQPRDAWFVIPPHVLVHHACARLRGQHSENPFECLALSLRLFHGYRVAASELLEATRGSIAQAAAHSSVRAIMRCVLDECREQSKRHRVAVRAALDADAVVSPRGSQLLPW